MFSLELTKNRPSNAQPYYCAAVRNPYTIGRLDDCDMYFDDKEVSRQHATLTVSLTAETSHYPIVPPLSATTSSEAEPIHAHSSPNDGSTNSLMTIQQHLTLTFTNYSKFGSVVNGRVITGNCTVPTGSVIQIGSTPLKVTYRPVVVSISQMYSPEYIKEIADMMSHLGAHVLPSTGPVHLTTDILGTEDAPLACFHICEEINDDADCLAALVYGYSLVLPSYVFEWFAALAENPGEPLHRLPSPCGFSPPKSMLLYDSVEYLRPEGDLCPFSLFPYPKTGLVRHRSNLFLRRQFVIPEPKLRVKLAPLVAACGATLVPDISESLGGTSSQSSRLQYYVISHQHYERLVLEDGNYSEEEVIDALESGWKVISDRDIAKGFVVNQFAGESLPLPKQQEHHSREESEAMMLEGNTSPPPVERSLVFPSSLRQQSSPPMRRENDSDATPSEIDTQSQVLDDEEELEVEHEYQLMQQAVQTNRVFVAHFERMRTMFQRSILPCTARVDDVLQAASRHRYVSGSSVNFLEDTYEKCQRHLAALEDLSTSAEGNNHAAVLQQQWDTCTSMQQRVVEGIQLASTLGDRQAKKSKYASQNNNPHFLPPQEIQQITSPATSSQQSNSVPRGARRSKSPTTVQGIIPEATRLARYFPPAPIKARIHIQLQPKKHEDESSPRKLAVNYPPTELAKIAQHRVLFLRKFGSREGEMRYSMWLNGQTTQWTQDFYKMLEEKKLTLRDLLETYK